MAEPVSPSPPDGRLGSSPLDHTSPWKTALSPCQHRPTFQPIVRPTIFQSTCCRLASACEDSKAKELYDYPTPGAPVGRVAAIEHPRGRRAETMCWPDQGEKPAVRITILEDDAAAKRAAELWAKRKEIKAGSGTWTWWTDGSRTDDGRLGAAAVCLNGDRWTVFHSDLGTGRMEVFNA